MANKEFSNMQTLTDPSSKDFTNFDNIKFTVKTKSVKEVSVAPDQCGGTNSYATAANEDVEEMF